MWVDFCSTVAVPLQCRYPLANNTGTIPQTTTLVIVPPVPSDSTGTTAGSRLNRGTATGSKSVKKNKAGQVSVVSEQSLAPSGAINDIYSSIERHHIPTRLKPSRQSSRNDTPPPPPAVPQITNEPSIPWSSSAAQSNTRAIVQNFYTRPLGRKNKTPFLAAKKQQTLTNVG